jgi:hypothetical protein
VGEVLHVAGSKGVMKIGFTGTREGMTREQRAAFFQFVKGLDPHARISFHHGCCLGADASAVDIIDRKHGLSDIYGYPSNLKGMTSENAIRLSNVVYPPLPPLERNKNIVSAVDVLVACPKGPEASNFKSGTWATIRYARKNGIRIVILWPNGNTTEEIANAGR